MDKIYFNSPISSEYRILCEYAKKTFCKTPQIIKIKESGWSRVFLVRCQKPNRRFILKCSVTNVDIEHEHTSLLFLKKNGIANVPQVIAFENFRNLYVLSLNFIENSDKINAKSQEKLARILAQIHSIKSRSTDSACFEQVHKILDDVSCFVSYLNQPDRLSLHKKCKRLIHLLNMTIERNKIYFLERQDLVFVNGDLSDDAIYLCGDEVNIIDWHASGFADNAWDIARLFLNNPKIIDRKLFLKEYLLHIEDQHFTKRLETYWVLNKLFTLLYFFFKSEWYSVPMQYGSKNLLEENLDSLLKHYLFIEYV